MFFFDISLFMPSKQLFELFFLLENKLERLAVTFQDINGIDTDD